RDGDDFILNGNKMWITNGPDADVLIVYAKTDPAAGARGITAFMIDTDQPGFGRGKTEPKLGIRASATCEIEFADYVAQAGDVVGNEGDGFK
ncbi:acyl-CoA dehydrogenase family protein, partial [Paraburkholderia sp. SIMBA_054]|uniref:acyl-CoA dehydrogenase family protein n=1 Tax=Paraburkholderia sp. SIMBA_054 TaxID=3085795 RepID=UPI00397808F9